MFLFCGVKRRKRAVWVGSMKTGTSYSQLVCKENSLAYFCFYRSMFSKIFPKVRTQMKCLFPFSTFSACLQNVAYIYFTFSFFVDVPTFLKPCCLINVHTTLPNRQPTADGVMLSVNSNNDGGELPHLCRSVHTTSIILRNTAYV